MRSSRVKGQVQAGPEAVPAREAQAPLVPLSSAANASPNDSPGHAGRHPEKSRARCQRVSRSFRAAPLKDLILNSFKDLGLAEPIAKALAEEGYERPTPIQAQAIPHVLAGKDLLGIAQTGTGKTAAFALPILHRLAANRRPAARKGCRVLVLSPTRELATQIGDSFKTYGSHLGISVAVVFGGVGHRPQVVALQGGVDVLVATPGRLIDHMDERNVVLEGTEIFVLDEADQMLDLGFVKPIRRIVSKLSHRRQSLFLSATMPAEIGELASELLNEHPVKVSVAPAATTVERVDQKVIHVERVKKRALLVELLSSPDMSRTIVFTRTKRGADRVAHHLEGAGIEAAAIHGNKSQSQREKALAGFKVGKTRVLVATDIAARGIDIDLVSHVVNFELPDVPESYVHRIGRTARAGASGNAISLVDGEERGLLRDIERVTRQSIPSEDRRNDASLAADKTTPGRPQQHRQGQERKPQQGRGHQHGEARREGNRDGSRSGGRAAQPHARSRQGNDGHHHASSGARGNGHGHDHARGGERRARTDREPEVWSNYGGERNFDRGGEHRGGEGRQRDERKAHGGPGRDGERRSGGGRGHRGQRNGGDARPGRERHAQGGDGR